MFTKVLVVKSFYGHIAAISCCSLHSFTHGNLYKLIIELFSEKKLITKIIIGLLLCKIIVMIKIALLVELLYKRKLQVSHNQQHKALNTGVSLVCRINNNYYLFYILEVRSLRSHIIVLIHPSCGVMIKSHCLPPRLFL